MTKFIPLALGVVISMFSVGSYAEDGEIVLKARGDGLDQTTQLTLTTRFVGVEPDEID